MNFQNKTYRSKINFFQEKRVELEFSKITRVIKIISKKESLRFLNVVQKLKKLKGRDLSRLNIEVKKSKLKRNLKKAIF